MANIITNILRSSTEVLAALRGDDEIIDFSALIPIPPEETGITPEYTITSLVDLLTGQVDFRPAEDDLIGKMKLSFILRLLTKSGGIAAFKNHDEFENFVKALRYQRYEGCFNRQHLMYPSDWIWKHWGTKENTSGAIQTGDRVQFETTWSAPHRVIESLAARFPDQRIEFLWADEDIGRNCGHRIFELGGMHEVLLEDPVDFALTVTGRKRYRYLKSPETGKWKHRGY